MVTIRIVLVHMMSLCLLSRVMGGDALLLYSHALYLSIGLHLSVIL